MVQSSDPIAGHAPVVNISSPMNGRSFEVTEAAPNFFGIDLLLSGEANHLESGQTPDNRLVWTTRRNNDPEETLGVGTSIQARLRAAGLAATTTHTITLYATDTSGVVGSQSVTIDYDSRTWITMVSLSHRRQSSERIQIRLIPIRMVFGTALKYFCIRAQVRTAAGRQLLRRRNH